ncbi:MAG: hypothetical protein KIS73_20785 [Enhydrobacter sp.]|nr:hypothetical protein [Enhydrobacter sp.]
MAGNGTNGNPLAFRLRFTDVYAKRGDRWQMVAWQSTKLPLIELKGSSS